MRIRKNSAQFDHGTMRTTTSKPYIWNPGIPAVLVLGLILLPSLAFGQQTIDTSLTGLGTYIYSTLRWPVCFLGLTVAAGLARFRDDGVSKAVGILGMTIAWALVPATIDVLKRLFG
jgi:hypothetical protein